MPLPDLIRNSKLLRWPLLTTSKLLLSLLKAGPPLLRRAVYDAMPAGHLVTGNPELFVISTADKVIGRELFLHGEFDFGKLQTTMAIIEREGLSLPTHLIDVGANIGTIVIPALKRGLMQSATAIEPHPANLRLLHANLALNDLTHRVDVLGIAVGNTASNTLRLKESATNSGNHSIDTEGIPVQSARIDDLDIPLQRALLWMDIEGYEGHALDGALSLLHASIPIVSEFNPSYLSRSGGLELFCHHLQGRRIFDIGSSSNSETTLESLIRIHTETFTDILAL